MDSLELLEQHFDTAFAAPDGIKKLRELILTLAMQGKLVPQDPYDPPASQLLKEIEAEKKRLVKEGKMKAPKPLPEIKLEELPYELPQCWEWVRFGKIFSLEYGDNLPADQRSNTSEFPVYGSNGIVGTHNIAFVNSPCIVVGRKGSAGALKLSETYGCCVTDVAYYCIPPKGIDLQFSFKLFHTLKLNVLGKGIKPGLNRNEAYLLLCAIPPLPEQQRIVAKIDQLMARCDELEKLRAEREKKRLAVHTAAIKQLLNAQAQDAFTNAWQFLTQHFGELYSVKENVSELRKAILQLAVMGKLVPQDPNDPPARQLLKEIEAEKKRLVKEGKIKAPKPLPDIKPEEIPYPLPQGWEWARLANCMLKITDGTHHSPPNSEKGEFLYISAKNIKEDGVLLSNATYVTKEVHEEIYSRCDPEFGNVLYIKDGATTGIVTINNLKEPFSMLSSVALLKQPLQVSNRFLFFALKSPFFYQEMRAGMTGVAITRVTLKKMNDALFPLPPLPEQHRIVAKIDQLMSLCDKLEQQIDAAAHKQSALLNAVMAQV